MAPSANEILGGLSATAQKKGVEVVFSAGTFPDANSQNETGILFKGGCTLFDGCGTPQCESFVPRVRLPVRVVLSRDPAVKNPDADIFTPVKK